MSITAMSPRKSRRPRIHRRTPPGSPPGTLVSDPSAPRPVMRVIAYGPEGSTEKEIQRPAEVREFLGRWPVTWLNVDGLGDAQVIGELGEIFGLHRLALEDVVHVHQRAKVEQYDKNYYIVARAARLNQHLETEQVSLFLGANFLLTFQERVGDGWDPARARIRAGAGRIRTAGPDYLAYALLDAVIDDYFPILEQLGERLEILEDEIVTSPRSETISRIHEIKRSLLVLRRAVWPLRDALALLYRDVNPLFTEETRLYLRDSYDHTIQLFDLIETDRDMSSGLLDVYLSSLSNRMNEIMKVLTIISTIFIPLSFIAGVYGMNFNPGKSPWNMPELNWAWGYPFALGIMTTVAGILVYYFYRKGWIVSRPETGKPPSEG
jgi:magnesium transporter